MFIVYRYFNIIITIIINSVIINDYVVTTDLSSDALAAGRTDHWSLKQVHVTGQSWLSINAAVPQAMQVVLGHETDRRNVLRGKGQPHSELPVRFLKAWKKPKKTCAVR